MAKAEEVNLHDDINIQLKKLIKTHQSLDDKADALNARRLLTPYESKLLKTLKVRRLQAREAIDAFRKQNNIREEEREY